MVQGMAFLSKKGFNPTNNVNRKQVWEAQQSKKLDDERIRKRQAQLRKEREDQELHAVRHGGDGSQAQLRFMYDAPPGLEPTSTMANNDDDEDDDERPRTEKDVTQIQPGDDAAAAAFRRMLAASASTKNKNKNNGEEHHVDETTDDEEDHDASSKQQQEHGFAPVLQGSRMDPMEDHNNKQKDKKKNKMQGGPDDNRSALEKAVGRKDRNGALTLEEQVARFPQLRHAPMAKGMSSTDVNVNFKPLGAQMRNVKCLSCGVWGHSRGDRECETTGWDPFSASRRPPVAAAILASTTTPATTTMPLNSIRPAATETRNKRDLKDERSTSSSSSSSSSDDSRRKRHKRKHRSSKRKSKHKHKHKESKRRRRDRSESPPRRTSHKKHKRSNKDDR
jgi:CBF1 interacting corepressor